MPSFSDRLCAAIEAKRAPCVVGLDPVIEHIPEAFVRACGLPRAGTNEERALLIEAYCLSVLDAVHELVPAIKPQMAYFELFGAAGMAALERCIEAARGLGLLVLLDAKRGDIGSTSAAYANAYLGTEPARRHEVDCLTLSPYLGRDSLEPFAKVALAHDKGLFVCVRTSNPGADLVQDALTSDGRRLYEVVADLVTELNAPSIGPSGYGSVGAVVGATQAEAAVRLRARMPGVIFLVPGFGAQGGSLETVRACFDEQARGALVSSSRAIMYPDKFGSTGALAGKDGVHSAARDFVGQVRSALA